MKPVQLVSAWGTIAGERVFIAIALRALRHDAEHCARLEFKERYNAHADFVYCVEE
jgi:hypothetical protein